MGKLFIMPSSSDNNYKILLISLGLLLLGNLAIVASQYKFINVLSSQSENINNRLLASQHKYQNNLNTLQLAVQNLEPEPAEIQPEIINTEIQTEEIQAQEIKPKIYYSSRQAKRPRKIHSNSIKNSSNNQPAEKTLSLNSTKNSLNNQSTEKIISLNSTEPTNSLSEHNQSTIEDEINKKAEINKKPEFIQNENQTTTELTLSKAKRCF